VRLAAKTIEHHMYIQANALSQGAITPARAASLQAAIRDFLPHRPYCTDDPHRGVAPRKLDTALKKLHIQPNNPAHIHFLTYDIDRQDAYFADYDGNVPPPNFTVANPHNGKAHLVYRLKTPVVISSAGHKEPIRYAADVDRGLRRRLGGDKGYNGMLIKTPFHPHWRTFCNREEPYELDELNDWLFPLDKRPEPTIPDTGGLGRNCILFDTLRKFSYKEVLSFKARGDSQLGYHRHLLEVALRLNDEFKSPMHAKEVTGIVKSVSKWTWNRFSAAKFSAIQSARIKKRWEGHVAASSTKPWGQEGISRATWYRRQKVAKAALVT
jgi:hypothetical protein